MDNYKNQISYFAKTNFRNQQRLFGIKQKDRLLHTYILGKTGTGKTNLLETMILQDIHFNRGLCLMDVHGDLITKVKTRIPENRLKDVVYLDITNPKQCFLFNPLVKVPKEKRSLIASGLIDVFQKMWKSAWGLKLEHILRYILLTLLDQDQADFSDILMILHDEDFRNRCIRNVRSDNIKMFWREEFPKYTKSDILPILNKVGAFLVYPAIKRLMVDNTEKIDFREIMDNEKILLINLSKGHLGEDISYILGSILLNSISFSAFTRIEIEEEKRKPFFIYLDEFQNYTTLSLVGMLSELRKFKLGLIMGNQYLDQLSREIKSAVLGNIGTLISFRLGPIDAQYMAKEFYPVFKTEDIINLENYDIYLKLMIDGKPSQPFSAKTIKWTN